MCRRCAPVEVREQLRGICPFFFHFCVGARDESQDARLVWQPPSLAGLLVLHFSNLEQFFILLFSYLFTIRVLFYSCFVVSLLRQGLST